MKYLLGICVLLSLIAAVHMDNSSCGRHGDPCVSDSECCANTKCHRYANICQVVITEEELIAQRENILGRRNSSLH